MYLNKKKISQKMQARKMKRVKRKRKIKRKSQVRKAKANPKNHPTTNSLMSANNHMIHPNPTYKLVRPPLIRKRKMKLKRMIKTPKTPMNKVIMAVKAKIKRKPRIFKERGHVLDQKINRKRLISVKNVSERNQLRKGSPATATKMTNISMTKRKKIKMKMKTSTSLKLMMIRKKRMMLTNLKIQRKLKRTRI
jgi:hypothetical protein